MRVNTRVFTERTDIFADLYVKNCPAQFEKEANRLLNMVAKPGYSTGDYHTMTELDKILMVDYWKEYDGLNLSQLESGWREWFIHTATSTELIRRARQFLTERNYIIVKSDVAEHAQEAGDKFRMSVRGK